MKALLLAVLVACGGAESKPEPAGAQSQAQVEAPLEEVALTWAQAALAGNRDAALALSLSHAQFAAISTKEISKAEFDEELAHLIDGLGREGKENPAGKIVEAKVAQKKSLPAGEKLKRPIEIAAVRMVIEMNGEKREAGMPMFFIKTGVGWRFTPKK